MGLKVTPGSARLERGAGIGGCVVLAVPLALIGKGAVLWYAYGWWHAGLALVLFAGAAFFKLSKVFATWNTRFIEVRGRTIRLGRLEKGHEHLDCQFSVDDLASVGVLKKNTHGAAYGLAAFLRIAPPPGSDLEKHGRIGDGYDLLWFTQEYAGTVQKLLAALQQQGVYTAEEFELQPAHE